MRQISSGSAMRFLIPWKSIFAFKEVNVRINIISIALIKLHPSLRGSIRTCHLVYAVAEDSTCIQQIQFRPILYSTWFNKDIALLGSASLATSAVEILHSCKEIVVAKAINLIREVI